jgi:hypothetical protein
MVKRDRKPVYFCDYCHKAGGREVFFDSGPIIRLGPIFRLHHGYEEPFRKKLIASELAPAHDADEIDDGQT